MEIRAQVMSCQGEYQTLLTTQGSAHSIDIPPKPDGYGSSANGGELLFLALATCYCNDIYREARKRDMRVEGVEVEVWGEFGADGEPASSVSYRAKITANASDEEIRDLMRLTDGMAEIHNTLRVATPVTLAEVEAVSTRE